MRVILVDFDQNRIAAVKDVLTSNNLETQVVTSADAALAAIAERACGVVVIEHALPGGAGALAQKIRAEGHGTPIVVLSDDDDPTVEVKLLDDGVDDVIVRPHPPELLPAQIRALIRRCAPNEGAVLKFADLELDLRSLKVTRQGQAIPATSRELAVLEYLMRNRQRVVSRNELSEAIWGDPTLPGSNVIEVFIARLRRKIDRPFDRPLIHTIVGRGYMLSVTKPGSPEEV